LLILDRKDDAVTPLLTQCTFQAMVHEMIGIENNLVDLSKCPSLKKDADAKQVVLSPEHDQFFKENMYKNFGDLGIALKELADKYQAQAQINQNINTIEDIKHFVVEFPQFKQLMSNLSKHMKLMQELQSQVAKRNLLDVSELEQSLACHEDITAAQKSLEEMIRNPSMDSTDLLRLVMLYMLRYENHPNFNLDKWISMLEERKISKEDIRLLSVLKQYGGQAARSPVDIFENRDFFQIARGSFKRGLLGVTNIFTQHKPLLHSILTDLIKGKLRENIYPFALGAPIIQKTVQIIVFVVGGITFEEALTAAEISVQNNVSIILGGTTIHNTKSFLTALRKYGEFKKVAKSST